jgi:ornithine carbamoyltransferase
MNPNHDTDAEPTGEPTVDGDEPPARLLEVDDLDAGTLERVLDRAAAMKAGESFRLEDAAVAMLFEKPSTRTRTSFETGLTKLGGHAMYMGPDQLHLGHGEPLKDTARVFACYADAVVARVNDHETVETLAAYADVPVVNGLSDLAHPCQALADLLTVREAFGDGAAVTWVGDGNNVARSLALGAALAGVDLTLSTPAGYGVEEAVLDRAAELGSAPDVVADPDAAVADADAVYTDVWVSMGDEDEREARLEAMEPYRVDADLLAGTDAKVLHCLPAVRGEEITDDVIEGERSLVWQQAENRMWTQNALLVELLG